MALRTEAQLKARHDARENMQETLAQLAQGPYLVHDGTYAAAQHNSLISHGSTWKKLVDNASIATLPIAQ